MMMSAIGYKQQLRTCRYQTMMYSLIFIGMVTILIGIIIVEGQYIYMVHYSEKITVHDNPDQEVGWEYHQKVAYQFTFKNKTWKFYKFDYRAEGMSSVVKLWRQNGKMKKKPLDIMAMVRFYYQIGY